MKGNSLCHCMLCLLFMTVACMPEDNVGDDNQIDESLLYGTWRLTDARGYGTITGDISGSFQFIGVASDATLEFPPGVLAGGAFRNGAVRGAMIYEPSDLGLPQDTLDWDNMLPIGAWTLTIGDYLYFEGGIYGDFDGVIDELTEHTFILTGRNANIQLLSNPGGNKATLDGLYTFTFVK